MRLRRPLRALDALRHGLEALGIVVALCAVPAALGADYGTNLSELHLKVVVPCMEDSKEQLHAWPAVL